MQDKPVDDCEATVVFLTLQKFEVIYKVVQD